MDPKLPYADNTYDVSEYLGVCCLTYVSPPASSPEAEHVVHVHRLSQMWCRLITSAGHWRSSRRCTEF